MSDHEAPQHQQQQHTNTPTGDPHAEATLPPKQRKAKKALKKLVSLSLLGAIGTVFKHLQDGDRRARRMAVFFTLSLAGMLGVVVIFGVHIWDIRKITSSLEDTGDQGKNLGEFIKKQADEAKRKFSTQSLGTFSIELKDSNPEQPRPAGVLNLAEVEIILECVDKETCEFVEERMPAVRNEVTKLFVALERDDLLSREGKRKLKERMLKQLNLWLPKGKVLNLYFNKLLIS